MRGGRWRDGTEEICQSFLRIHPDQPFFGSVSVVRVGRKKVHTASARVRILNISPGGLKFVSSLRLPADNRILLEICLALDGVNYCLRGAIVHCRNTEVNEYEYGFCFSEPDSNLRDALKNLFSRMYVVSDRHIVILKLR